MKLTKFGQSCLLLEEGGARILMDPGAYSKGYTDLTNLDAILITHVHPDHCDVTAIKQLLINNQSVKIYTNPQVHDVLTSQGIESQAITNGATVDISGVSVEACGTDHHEIHSSLPRDKNIGFLIANRFFQPGDAYTVPNKPIKILALPVGGLWLKIGETLDYALAIKPKLVLPIHDAMYANPNYGADWVGKILPQHGIQVQFFDGMNSLTV